MKPPIEHFRFCPRCGTALSDPGGGLRICCGECGFLYYLNPTCAAAGFLANAAGDILFIRRAHDPARGRLAVPGGFIDPGETAEQALQREIREEVGIEVERLQFICSQTNQYAYREVLYPVVDLFFTAALPPGRKARSLDGVAEVCWRAPASVGPEELAFPSIRAALHRYLHPS